MGTVILAIIKAPTVPSTCPLQYPALARNLVPEEVWDYQVRAIYALSPKDETKSAKSKPEALLLKSQAREIHLPVTKDLDKGHFAVLLLPGRRFCPWASSRLVKVAVKECFLLSRPP